jgi:hypothetical protein
VIRKHYPLARRLRDRRDDYLRFTIDGEYPGEGLFVVAMSSPTNAYSTRPTSSP